VIGTTVPKAAIKKDGNAMSSKGHINANVPLFCDNRDIIAESKATLVQCRAKRDFGLGIATTIGPHNVADSGISGSWVVDSQAGPEGDCGGRERSFFRFQHLVSPVANHLQGYPNRLPRIVSYRQEERGAFL
jgi:hypothetical protein